MQLKSFIYANRLIILLFLAFLILFPLGLYGLRFEPTATPPLQSVSPTQTPTAEPLREQDPQKKLLDYIQNRKPLSAADAHNKESIIRELTATGSVFQTEIISIEYIKSADLFQVEIKTNDISIAKSEAIAWFRNKGISQDGICALPVTFYLNYEIAEQFKKQQTIFSPLPDNC